MHAAILPLLFALAAGKLAMVLGGDGQGSPFDGTWATAYAGPGPWGSLAPALPSHPSQVYEALSTGAVALVILILLAAGAFRRKAGGAFLVGIALWALARAAVATTWRDPAAFGSLGREQLLCIAIAAGATVLLLVNVVATSRRGRAAPAGDAGGGSAGTAGTPGRRADRGAGGLAGPGGPPPGATPDWPDPSTRPRI